MAQEINSSNCNHNCSDCQANCESRTMDFTVPQNTGAKIKKIIGIVSGKGGVGKSMVTGLAAVSAMRAGMNVGIMDADITGPSIPRMFGLSERLRGTETSIYPAITGEGIKVVSSNLILDDPEAPVVWRGPVIAGLVKQFYSDVEWEDLDVLFVDMPPGTGDVPLTVFQSLPVDGILVVTSPQDLVAMIVGKALKMAELMNIPVLGLIENMSYVACPHCGEKIAVFGESHIEDIAAKYNVPVIAQLPIDQNLVPAADQGMLEAFKGDFLKMHIFDLGLQGGAGLLMFILQLTGLLRTSPVFFFAAMFLMAFAIGVDFVPGSNLSMEIMDYTIYKTGKDRSALTGVLEKFLEKAQSAVSSAVVGGILIAIGYQVDSVSGDYIGDLAKMPTMLTWMIVIMGLIPAILAFVGIMVIKDYPIDSTERGKIQEYISSHQTKKEID